jgi:signal transduction histidine kinase
MLRPAMLSFFFRKSPFERLEFDDSTRVERNLAAARMFLSSVCFIAIYMDPTEPVRFATLAYILLGAHVLYSLVTVAFSRLESRVWPRRGICIHVIDVCWAFVLTFFSSGPTNSPFFAFFIFALIAAAYRWHLRETLITTAVMVGLVMVEPLYNVGHQTELNRLLVRAAYLTVVGFLFGYLAGKEKRHRAEIFTLSNIIRNLRSEVGLTAAVHSTLQALREVYGSDVVWLAMESESDPRVYLWKSDRILGEVEEEIPEESVQAGSVGLFEWPALAWAATKKPERGLSVHGLTGSGELRPVTLSPAEETSPTGAFQRLFGVSIEFRKEWHARLFVFNPAAAISDQEGLLFLQSIADQVGPAIHSAYLHDQLRSSAGAVERARLARELHDGIVQSLVSAEMQLEVLRRQVERGQPPSVKDLQDLKEIVHGEVLALRDLMQQMRPPEVGPNQLLDFLARRVDRFQRDTGINSRFICELGEVELPAHICQEIARIVQEALVNVRKHSGARNVVVRLTRNDQFWMLAIDDDGRGFSFAGRRTLTELDDEHQGPLVVKERVRAIGGKLMIESVPGRKTHIEISFPHEVYSYPHS